VSDVCRRSHDLELELADPEARNANPTFDTLADLAAALDLEIELRVTERPARSTTPHTPVKVRAAA
jgi:hypothetical protein